MADSDPQQFLRDLDTMLWQAAEKLRSNLDAAQYKQAVLGLIFLTLAALRDALPPKLLSGELSVNIINPMKTEVL